VETGVTVVEGEEPVHGELRAEVVVLSRKHLLSHSRSNLGLEVEDRSETEISTLSALHNVKGKKDIETLAFSDRFEIRERGRERGGKTDLVVLRVLDSSSPTKGVHTGVDILVEMKTLLSFGDSSSSVHEDGVEEIGVTVMELAADPRERSSRERSERLLLSGGDVSEDSDVWEQGTDEEGHQQADLKG
jgi:hypothetical protein